MAELKEGGVLFVKYLIFLVVFSEVLAIQIKTREYLIRLSLITVGSKVSPTLALFSVGLCLFIYTLSKLYIL